MILNIYLIIFTFFLIGAVGFWQINRKKSNVDGRKNWVKYISYFIIIHLVFFSIISQPVLFHYICYFILAAGFLELISLFRVSKWDKPLFFAGSILTYSAFAVGFFFFGWLKMEILLFTFLITACFDAFSQVSGQLLGKRKLFPAISPSKTLEGLLGGTIVAFFAALLMQGLLNFKLPHTMLLTAGIVLFAFTGDIFTSWYKRQYKVKDFSNIIPGHGGFLDRFDSLISAGAFIGLYTFLNTYHI